MKPKDLKCPFTWEERRPVLHMGVLFVPEYSDRHKEWTFPGWDDPSIFGNNNRVCIEYCSGNGTWIFEKAIAYPEQNWVAVEYDFERVRKIWSKAQNKKLTNLFVVYGEALTFTREYLPANCLDKAYINFPDPWPKLKHAKNRLLQGPFIEELSKVLKTEGTLTAVTDDEPYCTQIIKGFLEHPTWQSTYPEPFYVKEWPGYGASFFDTLWRGKGCVIKYMNFINRKIDVRD